MRRSGGRWLVGGAAAMLVGCADGALAPSAVRAAAAPAAVLLARRELSLVDGDSAGLAPRVVDATGAPVDGAAVRWESTAPQVATVSAGGMVRALRAGAATVTAVASNGVRASATVAVTAAPAPAPVRDPGCAGGEPAALAVGEVREITAALGDTLCLRGPAGASYGLVLAHESSDAAQRIAFTAAVDGVAMPAPRMAGGVAPLASRAADGSGADAAVLHARALRGESARALGPRLAGARAAVAAAGGTLRPPSSARLSSAAVPEVGELLVLNTTTARACDAPVLRAGRVMARSARALVVADTANPAGGLGAADYAALAALFDSLVYPVVTDAFGEPTDVDGNGGRVTIFFTRAVNELTPAGSGAYVGGFFFARDLFPREGDAGLGACEGSNAGELLYMLAADPAGAVHGNRRSRELILRTAPGALAHELQHLVGASRRLYLNPGAAFPEALWLDEGLSHVAEELAFYRAARLAPRGDLSAAALGATALARGALDAYQASNLLRLGVYLARPASQSPFAADDSLGTRGAAWQLLRYAADRRGGDERAFWRALTDARTTGVASLAAAADVPVAELARDLAVAQLADDVARDPAPRFSQPSWRFRDLLGAPAAAPVPASLSLAPGAAAQAEVRGGSAAYALFTLGAGAEARLRVDAAAGQASVFLVRLR